MKYQVGEFHFCTVDRKTVDVFVGDGYDNHTRFEHGPKYVAYKLGRFMTGDEFQTVKGHIKQLFHAPKDIA